MNTDSMCARTRRLTREATICGGAVAVAAVAAVAAVSGCSSAATHAASVAGGANTNTASTVSLKACGSAQWTFGKPLPVGDGPYIYVPVQVVYKSGPRCRLNIAVSAQLTDAAGHRVPGGAATGTIRSIIGPAPGERQTSMTSITATSFLWSNWCRPAGSTIRVQVASSGHMLATVVPQRPMCIDPSRPINFTWGLKQLPG